MGVDRIIFLLVVIRVAENQAAPHAAGGLTCEGSRWKYQFVLSPEVNESNLLADLGESAKSAVILRPTIDGGSVQALVSPEHFLEFKNKSEALKVYGSHSLRCLDGEKGLAVFETGAHQLTAKLTELNRTAKANSSAQVTERLPLREFAEESCKTRDDCKIQVGKDSGNSSASNDVTKSSETPLNAILVSSSTSKIPRTSRATIKPPKKRKSKQKSTGKSARKFAKGESRTTSRDRKKSTKGVGTRRNNSGARKTTTAIAGKQNKTSFRLRASSTEEPWNMLMIMARKSLTKSNPPTKANPEKEGTASIATGKSSSFTKKFNARKTITGNKKSSKQGNRAKSNSLRKSATRLAKPKSSLANQQRKFVSKEGRQSSVFSKPTTRGPSAEKNRQRSRDRRWTNIYSGRGKRCGGNNSRNTRRAVGNNGQQDFTFNVPIACTVIKISSSCGSDCSGDTEDISPKTATEDITPEISSEQNESVPPSQPQPELVPGETVEVAPDEPVEVAPDEPVEAALNEPAGFAPGETGEVPPNEPAEVEPNEPAEVVPAEPIEVAPNEPVEIAPDESAVQPQDQLNDDYGQFVNTQTEETAVYGSGIDDEDYEVPQRNENARRPDVPQSIFKSVLPGYSPVAPLDYQVPLKPGSDESSARIPPIFKPGDMPKYPMVPKDDNQIREFKGFARPRYDPYYPRPPFRSSTAASRPPEMPKLPVNPENPFLTPIGSARLPQAPGGDFHHSGQSANEDDYHENDEESEGHKEKNGLDKKGPASVQTPMKPEDKSKEFSSNNKKDDEKDSKDDGDYGDEDYEDNDENYDEDYDNEDYGEEAGNTGKNDEDDYDLD